MQNLFQLYRTDVVDRKQTQGGHGSTDVEMQILCNTTRLGRPRLPLHMGLLAGFRTTHTLYGQGPLSHWQRQRPFPSHIGKAWTYLLDQSSFVVQILTVQSGTRLPRPGSGPQYRLGADPHKPHEPQVSSAATDPGASGVATAGTHCEGGPSGVGDPPMAATCGPTGMAAGASQLEPVGQDHPPRHPPPTTPAQPEPPREFS